MPLRHSVRAPVVPTPELARYVISWLCIGVIVHELYGFARFFLLFPIVAGIDFLGKVMIVDNALKLTDVLGAGVAFAIVVLWLHWNSQRLMIVAVMFASMITALRLAPFEFAAPQRAFGWVPFLGFMRGSVSVDVQSFCEKFFQYGGLVWLLGSRGTRLAAATLLTTLLLLGTSYAETYLPGRSAEITDATMALVIGGVFALLRRTGLQSENAIRPGGHGMNQQP